MLSFRHETVSGRLPTDLSRVLRNLKKKDSRKKSVPVEDADTISRTSKRSELIT